MDKYIRNVRSTVTGECEQMLKYISLRKRLKTLSKVYFVIFIFFIFYNLLIRLQYNE